MNDLKAVGGRSATEIVFFKQDCRQPTRNAFPQQRRAVNATPDDDEVVPVLQPRESGLVGENSAISGNSMQPAIRGGRRACRVSF